MRAASQSALPARTTNRTLSTALDRWIGVGPYYAMFPVGFALDVVRRFSRAGDGVLDPFAGRATGVFAAAARGRRAVGIEINPVGWVYGKVKLRPAAKWNVLSRLQEIASLAADRCLREELEALPDFFRWGYAHRVRRFLVCARQNLEWKNSRVDATVMAFLLTYLHGKRGAALSNQMRDGKAMSPNYAVAWWREREMKPPAVDPVPFLTKRVEWRYKKGIPQCAGGEVRFGDCIRVLQRIHHEVESGRHRPFRLLFTSPPYCGITNYHYDQWLRLWLLGGRSEPTRVSGHWTRKFESRADYAKLIDLAFEGCSAVMARNATVYVRTDAREFTLNTTLDSLRQHFPKHRVRMTHRPIVRLTQTALFGDRTSKPGEVDIILRR